MKGIILFFLILLIIFSIAFALSLKVGMPVVNTFGDVNNEFLSDLLNYISKENHWDLKFIYDNLDKIKNLIENNEIDMAISSFEKNNSLPTSKTLIEDWGILYKRYSDNKKVFNIFDLENSSIVVDNIYYYNYLKEKSKNYHLNLKIYFKGSSLEAFNYFKTKKVRYLLTENDFSQIRIYYRDITTTNFQFNPIDIVIVFRKNINPNIINVVNKEIAHLKNKKGSFYYENLLNYEIKNKNKFSKSVPEWMHYVFYFGGIIFIIFVLIVVYLKNNINHMIKELESKNNKIIKENKKLQLLRDKLIKLNKNLETSYQSLDKYTNSLETLYTILGNMTKENVYVNEVANDILNFAVNTIYPADFGSVSVNKNGKWTFLATVGHDKSRLNSLNLPSNYFIMPPKTLLIKDIVSEDKSIMPENIYKKVKDALMPIKETLLAPINIGGELSGNIALDVSKDNPSSFSNNSYKEIENISYILTAFLTIKHYNEFQKSFQKEIIFTLLRTLDLFDPNIEGHSEFVAQYSAKLGEAMGLDKNRVEDLYLAGLLHDIGKMGISKEILNKPTKLTKEEYEIVKEHPVLAYTVINTSDKLKKLAPIIRHHHERYDGKGYPDGLKGEEIPLESRIMAVVDSWEAMTTERTYKKALTFEEALEELRKNSGTQFDPEVVKAFFKLLHLEF